MRLDSEKLLSFGSTWFSSVRTGSKEFSSVFKPFNKKWFGLVLLYSGSVLLVRFSVQFTVRFGSVLWFF